MHLLVPVFLAAAAFTAIDPEAKSFSYPYPVHVFALQSQRQALQMAYLDVAPEKANGRAVVLLHGKNFSAAYWARTIAALTAAGFRVIAPDQIGFGKSSKPQSYQFSFVALAAHTAALLDKLGISRAAIVGHSMGGMLAARFALLYPERTEKLVLVDPLGLEDYGAYLGARTVDDWFAREKGQTPEKLREYMRKAYFDGVWKEEYDELIRLPAGWMLHRDYARVAWDAALTSDMIVTQPVVQDLERLTAPTLIIAGARDHTAVGRDQVPATVAARMGHVLELARAAAKRIPAAKVVEIPEAGHLPQVQDFSRYKEALLGFLER
jgi:pimeloyl-ACP methyl ester carboxylesterase